MTHRVVFSKGMQVEFPEESLWDWIFEKQIVLAGAGNDEDGNQYFEFDDSRDAMMFKLTFFEDFNL